LLIVDTSQIQPYVFGSNRLRENIGASHLVASATDGWAKDALIKVTIVKVHYPFARAYSLVLEVGRR
jgi:hypothetical protein